MSRKLLCLCDSPTMESGFGRVAQNLIRRWLKSGYFEQTWVWGIGYNGYPHNFPGLENRICPASSAAHPRWYDSHNLKVFTTMIEDADVGGTAGGFTHLWMLQDTFQLANIAGAIRQACQRAKIASFYYFPVDAPLGPAWTTIMAAVDVPVAYCEYGKSEAIKALRTPTFSKSLHTETLDKLNRTITATSKPALRAELLERRETEILNAENSRKVDAMRAGVVDNLIVIPHGVDSSVYRPLPPEEKLGVRKQMFADLVGPDDFLMINVGQHQVRKGLAQSLLVLRDIQEMRPQLKAKLYFHSQSVNTQEGTNLRDAAQQLGLEDGRDVFYGDTYFVNNYATGQEHTLNRIYNIADLLLTTTYGEGWGMPLTEAMAAGIPVAGPRHTAVEELLGRENGGLRMADGEAGLNRGILFDTLGLDMMVGDNSRLRPRCDVNDAARLIVAAATAPPEMVCSLASYAARGMDWTKSLYLNWDRIAAQWLQMFDGKPL